MAQAPFLVYLQDSGGGVWLLGVTNNGQITTAKQPSGTASVTAYALQDISIQKAWNLSVTTTGLLQTTAIAGEVCVNQILVNAPNGFLYAIKISNGILQTWIGSDCVYSFAGLRQEVANRLNDPNKVFWTDNELKVLVQNALRFWNVLTGDERVWYSLTLTPGTIWYDFLQIAGSPRQANVADSDLYSWLQFALLEQQLPNAQLSTAQFLTQDLVQSVQRKRDEFIFRTGCTSTVRPVSVTPNVAKIEVPNTVIETRRAYWVPTDPTKQAYPLMRSDEWSTSAYVSDLTQSDPDTFSAGVEPPLNITLAPPPNAPGMLELLTIESQSLLTIPCSTTLLVPSDFSPAIYWGVLGDLLSIPMEAQDPLRAKYAFDRYDQFTELLLHYPFVFSCKANDQPVYVDAVETLDIYDPYWRSVQANPQVAGLSGQNLVAFPCAAPQNISLFVLANANIPLSDTDCVKRDRSVMDAIIGYAVHCGLFKSGGEEFASSMPLLTRIVELAAQRNIKIQALSTFRKMLYQTAQREDQIAPKELANG